MFRNPNEDFLKTDNRAKSGNWPELVVLKSTITIVKAKLLFRRQRFTSLTNSQWQVIKKFVCTGRKRRHCLRSILDAIFKLNRTGCQWRNLGSPWRPALRWPFQGMCSHLQMGGANYAEAGKSKGFVPEKGRWQVERSFVWFNFFRRLRRDYEKTVESSLAFIQITFINIILARIAN